MKKLIVFLALSLFLITSSYADTVSSFVKSSWETNSGTIWNSCEDATGWTASGATASVSANTAGTNVKEKLGSINLVVTAFNTTATFTKDLGAQDLSSAKNITFWGRFTGVDRITSVTIEISSLADFSKKFSYTMTNSAYIYEALRARWQRYLIALPEFTNTGADTWTTVRYIRITFNGQATYGMSMSLDGLAYGYSLNKAKIIYTFDDVTDNVYTRAYPVMEANNQKGVVYVVSDWVGTGVGDAAYMSLAHLKTLYANGWDVGNHSKTHSHYDAVSDAACLADIKGGYDYLIANGFNRSAKYFAFPYGEYEYADIATAPNAITYCATYSVLCRSTHLFPTIQPAIIMNEQDTYASNNLLIPVYYVFSTTSAATVNSYIDSIIAAGGMGILLFHKIIADTDTADTVYKYKIGDFTTISNYIKTKQDAGTLDVVTMDDYYNSFIHADGSGL